jgi:hypothetical protein
MEQAFAVLVGVVFGVPLLAVAIFAAGLIVMGLAAIPGAAISAMRQHGDIAAHHHRPYIGRPALHH